MTYPAKYNLTITIRALFAWTLLFVSIFITFNSTAQNQQKIVSANGTITEILCELGFEKSLVGVDVTSTYPESLKDIKRIGHNRNLSSEGIVSLAPNIVFGMEKEFRPDLKDQLIGTGIEVVLFKQEYTIQGTKDLIAKVAQFTKSEAKGKVISAKIDADLAKLKKPKKAPKVVFIYARGAGTMMVAGKNTSLANIIELAGGINVFNDFEDFKPLTTESLVAANPDIILMFDSGLKSMNGIEGLLQIPGVAQTNAGKNKKVIEMDGQYLAGFSPRVGKAITELASKF